MEIDGEITRQLTRETEKLENSQTLPERGPSSKGSALPEPYIYVYSKNFGGKSQQAQSTQPVLERTGDMGLQSPKKFVQQSSRTPLSTGSFMESQLQIHYKNTKSERRGISLEANPNPEALAVTNLHQSVQNPTRDGRSLEIQSPRQNMETKKMETDQKTPPSICAHTKGDLPTPGLEEKSWKEEEEYGSILPKLQNLPPRGHQNELNLLQLVGNKNMEAFLSYPGTEKENGLSPPLDLIQTELSGPNQFPSHVTIAKGGSSRRKDGELGTITEGVDSSFDDVLLNHCGWNSIIEGIENEIPFLYWPYFGDQFFNKTYICDVWKVKFGLNRNANGIIARREIKDKIEQLLGDKTFKTRALYVKKLSAKSIKEGYCFYNNFNKLMEWIKA
ncbi:hypothetical protein U1Q18_038968 [Sarracenia purpurea var. burkii]